MDKETLKSNLKQRFERGLDLRVERTLSLRYRRIIGSHYFAPASTECLELYMGGYMLGCIMCSQALLEAVLKFVARINSMNFRKQVDELIRDLEQADVLGGKAISSAKNAWKHRNDFHHLNPGYSDLDLETKAKECIDAVCSLENDIFGGKIIEGSLLPNHPEYWEIRDDGTVPVFVRNLDV